MTRSLKAVGEQVAYRVAIILPHSKEILAEIDGGLRSLPTIMIHRWSRVAEQITTNIKAQWSLRTVVVDSLVSFDNKPGFAIVEALACDDSVTSTSLRPSSLDLISIGTCYRNLLQDVLSGTGKYCAPSLGLGWIDDAKKWLQANIQDQEIQFTGDIRQLNGGAGFALVRLGVSKGPAYWIKATGTPNRHEAAITEMLSKCSPSSLPPLIAVHQAWNAWAMEEVGGALADSIDVDTISLASVSLAQLQQRTIGHAEPFLDCGCGDQRIGVLRGYLPAFLDSVAHLASNSTSEDYACEITTVIPRLEYVLLLALEEMEQLGIPDTISNNDMKLANILSDGSRCVFIDWCHAYFGNPFLTFQHLYIYLSRRLPVLACAFRKGYAGAWADCLTPGQIQGALAFAPIVAPYAYLCARSPLSLSSRIADPRLRKGFWGVVRGILRAGDLLENEENHAHV